MSDIVTSPPHYNRGSIEAIQAIEVMVSEFSGPMAYLLGNCLKYIWRHKYKGHPAQDLDKALWYLDRARQHVGDAPTSPQPSNFGECVGCGNCAKLTKEQVEAAVAAQSNR